MHSQCRCDEQNSGIAVTGSFKMSLSDTQRSVNYAAPLLDRLLEIQVSDVKNCHYLSDSLKAR